MSTSVMERHNSRSALYDVATCPSTAADGNLFIYLVCVIFTTLRHNYIRRVWLSGFIFSKVKFNY